MEDIRIALQNFAEKLNREPDHKEFESTPDGRAKFLPISFVEMTLDEIFLGQWSTENFKWSAITNEVQGSLDLVVINPITQKELRRIGAASIIIQVDKLPDGITGQDKNQWALNPANKKSNALDLGFPKLKAECLKNAAQSLGKVFGRDINRKQVDSFKRVLGQLPDAAMKSALERIERGEIGVMELCEANFFLEDIQREMLKNAKPLQLNGTN